MDTTAKPFLKTSSSQTGAAVIEFAIVLTFLLLMVGGIVEFGRAFWYYDALAKATRDGARMMSRADSASLSTSASSAASLVVQEANAANLNPALANTNVSVRCLDESFASIGCGSGSAPTNVQVSITGYTIDIGRMIPFLPTRGTSATVFSNVPLAPQTTMPYLN